MGANGVIPFSPISFSLPTRLTTYIYYYDLQSKYPARMGRTGVTDAIVTRVHHDQNIRHLFPLK